MIKDINKATPPGFSLRTYAPADESALVEVWNAALWADPIAISIWRTKVLLDPNFRAEGCHVAEVNGAVRGFLLSITRQVPYYDEGLQADQAWITAFGVHPDWQGRGLGNALLEAALNRLQNIGCKRVTISSYVPNYFTPGVDTAAYGAGVEYLVRRGFKVISRPLSMRAELTGFRYPTAVTAADEKLRQQGIVIRPAVASDIVPVLAFIQRHFSADWYREAAGIFGDLFVGDPRMVNMIIAEQNGAVVGYAQHRAERFGPFGVNPELRSRGIGRVLLAATLMEMLKKGFHAAWFLWTGDDAARLYAVCGFHEVRRFAVLQKNL